MTNGPAPGAVAVNTHEGQVAIPVGGGHVVGRLGARAMRWVEESTGRSIDDVYTDFVKRAQAQSAGGTPANFPVSVAAAIVWAGVEHERRLQGRPGPEFTLDEVDAIVDEIGLDDLYGYALALLQLSLPFRKRAAEIEAAATKAGEPNPLDLLRKAAAGGTGTDTSEQVSTPASPSPTSGI